MCRRAATRPALCAFSTIATCCCPIASATIALIASPTFLRTLGLSETLRINGTARITDDAALLAASERHGRVPKVGLLIEVKEAYLHCAKAINRAALWDPSKHIDRAQLPTYAEMLADQVLGLTREESERQGEEMARRGMY
jgi:hypothetical protein